jgi:hypothetical protein
MKIRDIRKGIDDRDQSFLGSGVVIGLVLGIVAFLLLVPPDSGTTGTGAQADLSGAQSTGEPSSSPTSGSDQMQGCVQAATTMTPALRRAASSVDQWEVHVGAMNKLVVGALTLQQATNFWNQTRIGARHRIAAFDHAWTRVSRGGVDCPPPDLLPAHAPAQLRACARHVAADLRALHAARTAIATWSHHVHAMEMLRMGKMSPTMATQMWLAMWHRGQQEITSYRAAAHAVHQGPRCTAPDAPSQSPTT